ncbi:ANTAR domain-containing protein [Kibdelosporangium phytohabitans]|nr:ANTAR domain-containing protein [Kibdelosporangium phytohabitans]MBE1469356.1 anti-anti-sigma factor [Kibdelosporangium phytohabitans]
MSRAGSHLRMMAESRPDGGVVVRISGAIDADNSRALDHYLRTRLPAEARYVVVDLARVELLGARGVRTLIEHTDRLASQRRRLLTVAANPLVRRVLDSMHVAANLRLHDSLAAAVDVGATHSEPEEAGAGADPDVVSDLLAQIYGLREALRTRTVVARALGVVRERYRLADPAAFDLLRDSAQRHNIRLYTLARALLNASAPQGPVWFPGRLRRPAPSLSFVELQPHLRGNRSATLNAFLETAAGYVRTTMASVRLVDGPGEVLRTEQSLNLPPAVADHLAGTEKPPRPAEKAGTVIVADVAAATDLDGREVLLGAGVHASQSTPLLTVDDQFFGVVTTYHADCGFVPSKLQCARLGHAATEIATWLDWHARTVVLDALEHVHSCARSAGR